MPLLRSQTFRARSLRRNATQAEQVLWQLLRDRHLAGAKFRRQQPLGPWVVDFFCPEVRLVVEVDGPYHADPVTATRDIAREAWLRGGGLVVLRLTNDDVLHHPDRALRRIRRKLRQLRYLAHARPILPEIPSTEPVVGQHVGTER